MTLLAQSNTGAALAVGAVVLVLAVLLVLRSRRYFAQQDERPWPAGATARPQRKDPGHGPDPPAEVAGWEVRMHETSRQLSAQLDSKMSALQALIAEADRAAARLESALARSSPATGSTPPDQAEGLKWSPGRREEIYTLADYGLDAAEIARRVGSPIGEVELILGLRSKKTP